MLVKGEFYETLTNQRKDPEDLKSCMEETVQKLLKSDTDMNKPGMLLGKIQSGKTRAFIGIIALAFDNDYDMAIILTKGTKALAQQTYERLESDLSDFVKDDKVQIFDILHIPGNLPKWILKQKIIMVVKKEKNNLRRIIKALKETYPDLSKRKLLIVDDEADYASIGFRTCDQEGMIEINKIAQQINELRENVSQADFLQVTATPYSLYLQPEELKIPTTNAIFKPNRPAFTVLLPIYDGYVGGDFYFKESENESSVASYIYEEIKMDELDTLRKQDRRSFKVEEALTSDKIRILRRGIMNFIVGACIRRIQQRKAGTKEKKYSFVVHTEHGTKAHAWQEEIVTTLKELLVDSASKDKKILSELVKESYENLSKSIQIINAIVPSYEEVLEEVKRALKDDFIIINKVNSEREVEQLLDKKGQLKLATPLNIFIGGQILDRGITIENLIGFYYGRRPQKFQQDTVLQHSRMFGDRPKEDLAVTRFYTANIIHVVMTRIDEFDSGLREEFEKGGQEAGIVFIYKDPQDKIVPCSPNKIRLSTTTTLKPYKRMLPYGFQTGYKTKINIILENIDAIVKNVQPKDDKDKPFLIDLSVANLIIDNIAKMLECEQGFEWDVKSFKASIEFLSNTSNDPSTRGKVWCLVRTNRNVSRFKEDGTFFDAPDTSQTEGAIAKQTAIDIPMLMLFRQNGKKEQGWMGSPFWWPVSIAPKNTKTAVFSSELVEAE
jgi:hypothetical protein